MQYVLQRNQPNSLETSDDGMAENARNLTHLSDGIFMGFLERTPDSRAGKAGRWTEPDGEPQDRWEAAGHASISPAHRTASIIISHPPLTIGPIRTTSAVAGQRFLLSMRPFPPPFPGLARPRPLTDLSAPIPTSTLSTGAVDRGLLCPIFGIPPVVYRTVMRLTPLRLGVGGVC